MIYLKKVNGYADRFKNVGGWSRDGRVSYKVFKLSFVLDILLVEE